VGVGVFVGVGVAVTIRGVGVAAGSPPSFPQAENATARGMHAMINILFFILFSYKNNKKPA
jgi:hypothetical protein